jgi:putative CocE/NonD family hydrolase
MSMVAPIVAAQESDATAPPRGPFDFRTDPNVFIRMRDGARLATDLYIPRGDGRYPVVLMRTPYGNFPGNYLESSITFFATHGFAVAVQDKRGKFRSEGTYTVSGGDAEDGYDTVDWLSKQPWSNGRVGTYGCSYLGDVQIFLAQTKHPALKAMIPQASGSSVGSAGGLYRYFGVRVGGAVDWAAAIGWFADNGQKIFPKLPASLEHAEYTADYARWNQPPRPPVIDYERAWYHLPMKDALRDQGFPPSDFEDNISKSPTDPYWSRFPYMTDAYTSDVPALFVNSWYDFGADVTLFEFNHFRQHSVSETARANQYVIMSPHTHCASERAMRADAVVGSRSLGDTRFDYWQTYLTWFDYWLKQDPEARRKIDTWPRVRYYLMGANAWKAADSWPVPGMRSVNFYLSSRREANSLFGDGKLSRERPDGAGSSADTFRYDPASPVPSLGGAMCCTGTSAAMPGAQNQRPVEARRDVLVYTSEPLESGIDATGPVEIVLFVSSTAIDTDFTAKLVDVYPDGRAFNVLESILRARNRDGQDHEAWLQPGHVYPLRIPLGATSNYFGVGHRIRVEVSSSNFPRFDRNLNVGGINAKATHWAVATNRVHHSPEYPSRLVLPVVAAGSTVRK